MNEMPNIPTLPITRRKGGLRRALLGMTMMGSLVVALNSGVTQFVAWRLNYSPALGTPWFARYYAPWDWFDWAQAPWAGDASNTFQLAGAGVMLFVAVWAVVGVQIGASNRRRPQKIEGLYGTARWITTAAELRAIGFLPRAGEEHGAGVYIGAWTDPRTGKTRYLRHDGPEHIGAIAPTRSGKGVGLVLPTLLSYPQSCVVNDMKGELWGQTAGWRKDYAKNVVIKFDPASSEGSGRFNPLNEIRLDTIHAVGDTQNLVTMIVDPDGKGLNDHWAKTSHALLTGLVLHILHKIWEARDLGEETEEATLYTVAFYLSDPTRDVKSLYEEMKNTAAEFNGNDSLRPGMTSEKREVLKDARAVIAAAGRDMLNRPDNERGSVLSTAMSFLSLYRDPLVRRNTSSSDFRIHDLMNHEQPVTLYLVVRPSDKDRLRPLVRLVLNQIVRTLTREELKRLPDGRFISPHKRQMLLMLDEFAGSFGKLDIFEESLSFIAGYGMKAYIILQDREQLLKSYGPHENIISNLHIRIAYAPNQTQTGEWISELLGTTTIIKEDVTESGKRGSTLNQISRSYREIERPLMTADEVMHMRSPTKEAESGKITHPGDMLIFGAGQYAIYGTQILYFTDDAFQARSMVSPPETMRIARISPRSSVPAFKAAAEPKEAVVVPLRA
jgi:type IV secretion system protein VirD4